jgi:hypothetical protein
MLHRALELRLGELLSETPKIWRDPKLHGNDDFNQEIVNNLVNAAVLVSVLSPSFVKSEWCRKELQEFIHAAQKTSGVRIRNKSRIFKVVKTKGLHTTPSTHLNTLTTIAHKSCIEEQSLWPRFLTSTKTC